MSICKNLNRLPFICKIQHFFLKKKQHLLFNKLVIFFFSTPLCILLQELVSPLILVKVRFLFSFALCPSVFKDFTHTYTQHKVNLQKFGNCSAIPTFNMLMTLFFFSQQGSLREHTEQADEYAIPHGDWFEIVSCPHYLAEIVMFILPLSKQQDSGKRNTIKLFARCFRIL